MEDDRFEEEFNEQRIKIGDLDSRMKHVEGTLAVHSTKLDRILDFLSTSNGKPSYDPDKILGFIQKTVVIFTFVCGGILYMANNISSTGTIDLKTELAVTKYRLSEVESRLKWKVSIE